MCLGKVVMVETGRAGEPSRKVIRYKSPIKYSYVIRKLLVDHIYIIDSFNGGFGFRCL